jgi:hypothetical protein
MKIRSFGLMYLTIEVVIITKTHFETFDEARRRERWKNTNILESGLLSVNYFILQHMKNNGGFNVRQPFDYQEIFYNEAIYKLEKEWQRKLTDHEKHVLVYGYRVGRLVEAENEIKILFAK